MLGRRHRGTSYKYMSESVTYREPEQLRMFRVQGRSYDFSGHQQNQSLGAKRRMFISNMFMSSFCCITYDSALSFVLSSKYLS